VVAEQGRERLEVANSFWPENRRAIIVDLRGDPENVPATFTPMRRFANSVELIEALAIPASSTPAVGAYPEPHARNPGQGANVEWLKRKFDAGADEAIYHSSFSRPKHSCGSRCCAAAGHSHQNVTPGSCCDANWIATHLPPLRGSVPFALDEAYALRSG